MMEGYDARSYGDFLAADYDGVFAKMPATEDQIDLLVELAGDGPALELGIGTGRVAVPLAERGVRVIGVDSSERMLAKLREKAHGLPLELVHGDFTDFTPFEASSLVFSVFNTFFMLPSEEAQRRCLAATSSALRPGGSLVLELFVPNPDLFQGGQSVRVKSLAAQAVTLQASLHDAEQQTVDSQDIVVTATGIKLYPTRVHYLWPPQLDALASDAGLTLIDRFEGWDRTPFSPASRSHVSVYRRGRS